MDQATNGETAKRRRILDGALQVFLAYGFQRTTMDDIARAAEVSRPALYLVFRNKTDIYRAIASSLFERSAQAAQAALAGDGPFAERAEKAIDDAILAMMEGIVTSPHGAEMLDMKNALAADLAERWRNGFVDALTAAVETEAARRGTDLAARGLTAQTLAELLLDGLEGMKARATDPAEWRVGTRRLVRVLELSLQ
ncbi:TetR/AcrR family transcriptional regulator [Mesorhizobium xinjiangense]|uniref:TetR/AcrR family transcriptional regulator n=1 Tax=Mesorhizobium xinjiangense TaxID=2678685 RepID=UPI0012ED1269|nr:TetR/AcrR family transcriptional regulator [Mesorhizobium xinjiangense]